MKRMTLLSGITAGLTVIGIIVLVLMLTHYQTHITNFALEHTLLAPIIIILWRITGTVIPPIPGGILTFAFIPVIGWFWSFVYATIGFLIGSAVSFFLARKFREPLVAKFVPLKNLHKWEDNLSERTEFLAFLGIRFASGPISDFISYVAGLSKLSFKKFIAATTISLLPNAMVYYLGEEAYQAYQMYDEKNVYIGLGFLIIVGAAIYVLKDSRFFKKIIRKKKNKADPLTKDR